MAKPVEVFDKKFINIKEACIYYNKNYSSVVSRLRWGYALEEALGFNDITSVVVAGKNFKTVKEACVYYNVSYDKASLMLRDGFSYEEVFKQGTKAESINTQGKKYLSVVEACNSLGFSKRQILGRLRCGWSVEEAFELVPRMKDGIIDIFVWNRLGNGIRIHEYIDKGIYRCFKGIEVRYYSHDELLGIWKKEKAVKKDEKQYN